MDRRSGAWAFTATLCAVLTAPPPTGAAEPWAEPKIVSFDCEAPEPDDPARPGLRLWSGGGPAGAQWNQGEGPLLCLASIAMNGCEGNAAARLVVGDSAQSAALAPDRARLVVVRFAVGEWREFLKPDDALPGVELLEARLEVYGRCVPYGAPFLIVDGFVGGVAFGE